MKFLFLWTQCDNIIQKLSNSDTVCYIISITWFYFVMLQINKYSIGFFRFYYLMARLLLLAYYSLLESVLKKVFLYIGRLLGWTF
jgi:hypothetical protein